MSGYSRKLVSLEIALKEVIKDLKSEALKDVTGKTESHFRKCSDENDTQDIIEYINETKTKKKKKFNFWELLDKND